MLKVKKSTVIIAGSLCILQTLPGAGGTATEPLSSVTRKKKSSKKKKKKEERVVLIKLALCISNFPAPIKIVNSNMSNKLSWRGGGGHDGSGKQPVELPRKKQALVLTGRHIGVSSLTFTCKQLIFLTLVWRLTALGAISFLTIFPIFSFLKCSIANSHNQKLSKGLFRLVSPA